MPTDTTSHTGRREFLVAAAAGGLVGMSALAGCSGTDETGQDPTTDRSDASTEVGSLGAPLPTYRYLNNPPSYNAERNDAINLIAERMREVGFDVDVQVFEWGTLFSKVTDEGDYDFATWTTGMGLDPGRRLPTFYHSKNVGGNGNYTGYQNADLDPLLERQLSVTDPQERVDLLHEIQEVVIEDAPINPIVQMPNLLAYNSEQVSGWVDHLAGYNGFYNMTSIQVDGGELRGSWPEAIGTLNPLGYNNESKIRFHLDLIYDKLIRFNPDLEADPELGLASDWHRPDARSVEYTIREGHKWHDGRPVTAEDVEFTLEFIARQQVPLYATQWERIDEVERDGDVIRVTFTESIGPVHMTFSNQIPILPKHRWESRGEPQKMALDEPVGSGPLQFDYWDKGSELGLRRYDEHWRPVNFERRIWRIIPEASTNWELLKTGDLNYLPLSRLGRDLAENADHDNIGVVSSPSANWNHTSINVTKSGLDDRAVRQAIVHTIPKTTIAEQLFFDFPTPGWNVIPEAFGQFSNPDVTRYEEGLSHAKDRLKDAGYAWDQEGRLHAPN